jgi:hypothetical protein
MKTVEQRLADLEERFRGINQRDTVIEDKIAAIRAEYPQFTGGDVHVSAGLSRAGTDGDIIFNDPSEQYRAVFDFETNAFRPLTNPAKIEMLDRIRAVKRGE